MNPGIMAGEKISLVGANSMRSSAFPSVAPFAAPVERVIGGFVGAADAMVQQPSARSLRASQAQTCNMQTHTNNTSPQQHNKLRVVKSKSLKVDDSAKHDYL